MALIFFGFGFCYKPTTPVVVMCLLNQLAASQVQACHHGKQAKDKKLDTPEDKEKECCKLDAGSKTEESRTSRMATN